MAFPVIFLKRANKKKVTLILFILAACWHSQGVALHAALTVLQLSIGKKHNTGIFSTESDLPRDRGKDSGHE